MMIVYLVIFTKTLCYYLLKKHYNLWKNLGVPGPEPTFILGNLKDNFLLKKSPAELYSEIYNQFPEAPLVGIFRASTPSLIIRDPDLIRDFAVKSFPHFQDNDIFIDEKVDPISGKNPFFLRGAKWKITRTQLTPGFSSGKIKSVYPLLEEVSKEFVKYIDKHSSCKIKEACMRFTLDNVGTCAFGLDAKCFEEENPEFKQIADRFLTPEGFQSIKVFIVSLVPVLENFISIKFTPRDVEDKLYRIIKDTLRYRQENNIIRNDYLHIITDLGKKNQDFSYVDITAHAAGFFADGYETSSVSMHFLLYELAKNSEIQQKLRDEINEIFEKHGSLPYDDLQNLPYLDAVFNESLRMHPPLGSLNKRCTKDYVYIPKENATTIKSFVIKSGTPVIFPLYALQRDPKYFKDPDSFRPERFLEKDIVKYSFLPFGEGPRACLGQRFGALQIKVGVAYLIRNFEICVNDNTLLPLVYNPTYFLTLPKDPIWLDFKKIKNL